MTFVPLSEARALPGSGGEKPELAPLSHGAIMAKDDRTTRKDFEQTGTSRDERAMDLPMRELNESEGDSVKGGLRRGEIPPEEEEVPQV
jgi:hypothetical protein